MEFSLADVLSWDQGRRPPPLSDPVLLDQATYSLVKAKAQPTAFSPVLLWPCVSSSLLWNDEWVGLPLCGCLGLLSDINLASP